MIKNRKQILILKVIFTLILYISALNFENAYKTRTIIYIILLAIYLLINLWRYTSKGESLKLYSFLLELGVIFTFEYNSRYQVNYIFHLFYFLILLEIPNNLNKKQSLTISIITIIISNIKFIMLLYLKPSFGNISQGGFFLLTGVFISLLMNFLKYYKEEEQKKEILNKDLMNANIRLNEMTIIEERNRIARDLHDTIGHGLTGTIMGLEMVQVLLGEDLDKAKEMIVNLKDNSRENLVKVREVVSTLNPNENISKGIESIKELIDSFQFKSNIVIELTTNGVAMETNPSINIVLYRIIQEGLTNAIRHGKADKIDIKITFTKDYIELYIKDNGLGSIDINKGFGLKSMEDRIFSLGGTISFLSVNGFSIVANIPMEVEND